MINSNNNNIKGLNGLVNLGNTCYINSCLQILSHTPEMDKCFENISESKKVKNIHETNLLNEWINLKSKLWGENKSIIPDNFIKSIQIVAKLKNITTFTGDAQNDISEFLIFFINCLHETTSREVTITYTGNAVTELDLLAIKCYDMIKLLYTKEYSEIWNLFYGISLTKITKISDNSCINNVPEPFMTISLPIPTDNKLPNLMDCFDLYVKEEIIKDFVVDTSNNKTEICKQTLFWSFPNILIIDLKRFTPLLRKNQILVTFPTDLLDLTKYVVGYNNEQYKYSLFGVCNHSGNVLGGHYTSYVKNIHNKWYLFNDTIVTEVSDVNKIISPQAYVLFYRKIPITNK